MKNLIPAIIFGGIACGIVPAFGQAKGPSSSRFNKDLSEANLTFTLPTGFKETRPANNNDGFDYAIAVPDGSFEIWFKAKSLKDNRPIKINDRQVNPDSAYVEIGHAQAEDYVGSNKNFISRRVPPYQLEHYGADAGRTFLVNLPDQADTKHYKYALIVVLQKNHVGAVEAVCFANELGPGFFKNLSQASSCIRFNP